MPKPHPKEFRGDVVRVARQGDAPLTQIAADFGVSETTVCITGSNVPISKTGCALGSSKLSLWSCGNYASQAQPAAGAGERSAASCVGVFVAGQPQVGSASPK